MISKVIIQNFERFEPTEFILKPEGMTLLQTLAVWEFARAVIEANKGKAAGDVVPRMAYLPPFAGSVAGKRILDHIGMEANIGRAPLRHAVRDCHR